MEKRLNLFLFLAIWILPYKGVYAQKDQLKPEEIEVVTAYTPFLADAFKIHFPASVYPRESAEKLELFYSVPVKRLPIAFSPSPLRPLAIGKEPPEKIQPSYIKLGFGTQYSPLVEAVYNSGKFEKLNYGFFYRHFSAYGQKIKNQRHSENQGKLFVNYYLKRAKLHSEFNYDRKGVRYYGYNHADTSIDGDKIKQVFNFISWSADVANTESKHDFQYHILLGFGSYLSRDDIVESDPWLKADFVKVFKKNHYVYLHIAEENIIVKKDTFRLNRNIFTLKPSYMYNDGNWKAFAGVDLTWEENIFHLFPDVGLERSLYKQYLILYNGYRMALQKNSYLTLTGENPWMKFTSDLRNSWYDDAYLGVKGSAKDFSYNLKFSRRVIRRLPLFVNDTVNIAQDPTAMKRFAVIYDRKTATMNLHAELFYKVFRDLSVNFTFDYFHYEMDMQQKPWHLPAFKVDLNAQYMIRQKVYLTLDVFARSGVYARIQDTAVDTAFVLKPEKLKPTADINIGAVYKFSKHFSFFCNLNNLAAIKYEKYYLYPSYGFNMVAGAIFAY
ncbi:MAG: hypothetical protein KatS3mg031_2057 [Chitinophagales bacterium]|nr:MAG: hypothetical protein KatS3mg031_2057 [Chitinophagales bacterium]